MRVEIIPASGIVELATQTLALETTLTVTCLPHQGLAATVQTSIELVQAGFTVVPHLAARLISGEAELLSVLSQLFESGITSLFIIGGDAPVAAGPYADAIALLRKIRELTGSRFELGVGAYPEGHPHFDRDSGIQLLVVKQEWADYAVTQMCFDAKALTSFVVEARQRGVTLPLWMGAPSAVRTRKLLAVAAKIGIATSLSFVRDGMALKLLTRPRFASTEFVSEVLDAKGLPLEAFSGVHLYSFNDLESLVIT